MILNQIPDKTLKQIQAFAFKYELDFEGQLLKLQEELTEIQEATSEEEVIKELADLAIVMVSALSVCHATLQDRAKVFMYYSILSKIPDTLVTKVLDEIVSKADINDSRTWVRLSDGRLKHK
jgi:hypothetical protein